MHFNPEGNYYITLGLPQNISQDELSRRWKRLMLLYHPDRQGGNEEWVSERAKKVNEAYAALKDEAKRAAYDRKLTEQMLNQKFSETSSHGDPVHYRPSRTFSRSLRNETSSLPLNTIRRYAPKMLIGVYALIAAVVLGVIYLQNRSSQIETELSPEPARVRSSEPSKLPSATSVTDVSAKEISPKAPAATPQVMKREAPRGEEKRTASSPSTMQSIRKWFQPKEQKQQTQKQNGEGVIASPLSNREVKQQEGGLPMLAPAKPSSSELRPWEHKEDHQNQQVTAKTQPEQKQGQQQDAPKAMQEVRQQVIPLQKPEPITREEVEDFMQKYVRAYTRNDLNAFMSLFSPVAVENNTMTYNDIRNAYKETFSEKINYYKILNMDIKTDNQAATVAGIYNINRYISSEDRWVKYSGKIVWKLIRENNQIRIISTNYDK